MPQEITPVEIVAPDPIPVKVTGALPTPSKVQNQETNPSRAANTTFQEDLTLAGQRSVNLIWEYTQAFIAIAVVLSTMMAGVWSVYIGTEKPIPTIISVAFGTVVGFYFSRTNHAAIGGVGPKAEGPYTGR